MSNQVCFKSDTKAARFSTVKLVCFGMTFETIKAGEAITRSLRNKKDTCRDIPEIMKTIKRGKCVGYRVGSHDWNKPIENNHSEEKMFARSFGMPCEDDAEYTTPLTETYYNEDKFIESMTPERLAIDSENHTNRFRHAIGKVSEIPFWARALFDERPFSLLRI